MKNSLKKVGIFLILISVVFSCGCKTNAVEQESLVGKDSAIYKDMPEDAPLEELSESPSEEDLPEEATEEAEAEEESEDEENPVPPEILLDEKDVFSMCIKRMQYVEDFYTVSIMISPDGSFTGDAVETIKHVNYNFKCEFSGQFTEPEKRGNGIYKTKIESLKWNEEYREEMDGGLSYCLDYDEFLTLLGERSIGIAEGDEFEIYFPGASCDEINGEYLDINGSWYVSENRKVLPKGYVWLYNVTGNFLYEQEYDFNSEYLHYSAKKGNVTVSLLMTIRDISINIFTDEEERKRYADMDSTIDDEENDGYGYHIFGEVIEDDQTDFLMEKNKDRSSPNSPDGLCRLHIEYMDEKKEKVLITIVCEDGGDLTFWGGTSSGTFTAELGLDDEFKLY